MSNFPVSVAVEGPTDAAIARRLLTHVNLSIGSVYGQRGKGFLDLKLPGYNAAARFSPWLILRDLDRDAACAPDLIVHLLPAPSSQMRLRIAVVSAEAWLLSDRRGFARFLGVAASQIPADPETIRSPKGLVVDLARHSPRRSIRTDMVPAPGTTAKVGPAYTARIIEFVTNAWRPDLAASSSASLRKCIERLRSW